MALELSSIVFKASTDELDAAVKKIETLGKSVEGLASSLGKLDKETSDASKAQSQANLNNAKTEAINIKNAKALRDSAAATEELTAATKKRQSVEERQAAITRLMAEGNSRGQASILATAEALGEATEKTNEYLKAQRAMSSNNPFDRSLGAATVFANELKVATVASDLYNKDLGFTKNQLQELGREHVRLTEQFKVQGKSLSGLDAEFNKIVQSAQQVTQAENAMATSMKNGQKATIDAGKANAYIENELQKVRFALQANNEELNRGTSNSLVRFENALKKSGLTLDQQKVKIDEYRKAQIELQKTTSSNQTDYITRAVGPQITDIIVGLSTGQSPLTVMMQQGGQLRDQFGMMGIAAKDMGDVMRNAMKGMASSVFDTGKAITTMLAGGMFDAGKAVVNYASSFLFVDKAIEKARENIIGMSKDFDTATENLAKFDKIAGGIGKVFAFFTLAIITTLAAVGVAAVQNIKLMNELSQTLVSVGASYGLTSSQVVEYANAISGAGISTQGSIAAMTQMIKAGAGTAASLKEITLAAMELEKAGGPSVEKISKMYSDLEKDPVKALSELRLNTGLVTDENIKNIESLIEQGDEIKSVEESTRILTEANRTMAAQLIADMNPLQVLWMDMKGALSDLWNGVNDLATSSGVVVAFRVVWESVALVIKQVAGSIKGLATGIVAIMTGDFKTAATIFSETWSDLGTNYATAIANTTKTMEGNNALQSEAVNNAKKQVEAEKERLALTKAMKDVKDKDDKLNAKTLTQAQFINKMVEDKNKVLVKGTQLEGENLAMVQRVAKAEWEALQPKAKKAKLSDEQKKENKALEDYIDLMNKAVGLNKDYNNILDGLQFRKKNGKLTEEEYVKAVEELIKQQKFYTDGLAEEEKAQKAAQKAAADHMKLVEEFTKIQDEFTAISLKNQEGIQQENSALSLRVALLGKTDEEQKKINESYKVQGELSKINAKYDKQRLDLQQTYLKLQADGLDVDYGVWNRQIQQSVQQQGEEAKLVWAGVAMSAAESMQKEFDAIKSSITDVITTALFDGGKAGSKKLRDQVVSAFRDKITVVIDAVVNTALTELLSGASGGSIGGAGAGQTGSGILGALSTGKSFVDALSGSMNSAIATSFGKFAGSGIGQSLGLSNSASIAGNNPSAFVPAGGQLTSTGTMLQGAMQGAASIAVGLTLNKAISGGYSLGKGMDNFQKAAIVLSEVFGPAGKFVGAIVGAATGLFNRAFGRKLTETGIQGTFGGNQGFTGQNYKFEEGGWFRSDKTSTSTMDEGVRQGLASQFNLIKSSVGFMAATLGQGTDAIASFTAELKINFKDLSEEDAAKKLQEEFDKIGETLAGVALGTTEYNRTGETNLETLTRLHTSLLTVNSAMSVMDGYLFDISLSGANASQYLVDLMGGVEGFTKTMGDYYNNFYTEEERTATATKNLTTDFAKLGYILPEINDTTREWFRTEEKRLGAMDLSIKANADNYASFMGLQAGLNKLAPTFDEVADKSKEAADALIEAAEKMRESSLNANKVAVSMGLTTNIKVAENVANEAWATFKRMMPQASQYSEADIVNFARDPAKMKLLSASDQNIINTFVSAIGAWTDAKATANKPYEDALKNIKDQTTGFISELSNAGKSSFDTAVDKIREAAKDRLAELNKLGSTATIQGKTDGFTQDMATAKAQADRYNSTIYTALGETAEVFLNTLDATFTLMQDNTAVVDAWVKAQIDLLKAQKAQTEKVDLEKQYADLTKTSAQLLKEQRDALEESNVALFDSIQLLKAQKLAAQATSDYNIALADALGNTKESARLQRELSDATKLANGWTQLQIDTLNKARDLVALKDGLSSLETARMAVVNSFKAIEDAAKNTQAAVDSAKGAITQGYVNAVEQQTQAQEVINDLIRQAAVEMAGFATSIRDFLLQMSTTDIGADSKINQLGALIKDFNTTANEAKSGNTKAYGSITGKASSLLTAGKDQFATAIEFARFSSNIGNTLAELATIADGKAGPLAEAVDPMVKAQADLLKANQEVAKWTLAVSESGASTSLTVADYAADWRKANADNIKAQADLLAAQILTKDINKQLVTVLGDLAALIGVYNTANAATPVYGGSATVNSTGASGEVKTIQDLYTTYLGRQGDIAGMQFWANAFLGDGVIDSTEREQFIVSAVPEFLSSLNSFDVGTNSVPTDMYASLHKGERIIPAADNQELMQRLSSPMNSDNSELIQEIQYVNNRLAIIESNTASTAGHAAKTARLLDRAMPDGDAIAIREAAAI